MRLADDDFTVSFGTKDIVLRPHLRAALRLERQYGGFSELIGRLADCSLQALVDVVREAADTSIDAETLIAGMCERGLILELTSAAVQAIRFVYALAGIDPDQATDTQPASDDVAKVTFEEHHRRLFQIATGALGWAPAVAWQSTQAEIIEAYRGRLDLLSAMFGGTDKGRGTDPDLPLEEKWTMAMQTFGTTKVSRT